MSHLSSRQAVGVWLLLVAATLLTGKTAGGSVVSGAGTVVFVLLIALFKMRMVIRYYMEVRNAPTLLQLAFEAWAWGVTAMIGVLWWAQY